MDGDPTDGLNRGVSGIFGGNGGFTVNCDVADGGGGAGTGKDGWVAATLGG